MSVETTGAGGSAGNGQVPAGGPEAGEERGTGADSYGAQGPDQSGQPKGKPGPDAPGGSGLSNGGLAKVFAESGPEAGKERGTGAGGAGAQGPDQSGQPKGKLESTQSNDNLSLPVWAQQLSKKLTSDPRSASFGAFKSLDEFAQAYLDGQLKDVPGKDSTPEQVQAFYESLGKPKTAEEYTFASNDPALARFAFEHNLSAAQAEAMYSTGLEQIANAQKAAQTALAQDFQSTDSLLHKEYGEKYDEAIAFMGRGLGNNPQTGALSPLARALIQAGLAGKPEIVHAFIELGRATSEGTAPWGASGAAQPASVTQGRGFSYPT